HKLDHNTTFLGANRTYAPHMASDVTSGANAAEKESPLAVASVNVAGDELQEAGLILCRRYRADFSTRMLDALHCRLQALQLVVMSEDVDDAHVVELVCRFTIRLADN